MSRDTSVPSCRSGFTLVELLVVIGIITLLISVLLPTINKAREQANRTLCLSNVRQLSLSAIQYANEYKGIFPCEPHRTTGIQNYLHLDVFRADMYMLMKFGQKNVLPSTKSPDRVWQCPSINTSWQVITAPANFGNDALRPGTPVDLIRTSYMYLGAGMTVKTALFDSWEANATRRPHRLGLRGDPRVLFADEASNTSATAVALSSVNVLGWRINHPPKGTLWKTVSGFQQGFVAGTNQSFTDGHAEWVKLALPLKIGEPNSTFPNIFGNGNASAVQLNSTISAASLVSWWW